MRGRPRLAIDAEAIVRLRAGGSSWREVADEIGVSARTALRRAQKGADGSGHGNPTPRILPRRQNSIERIPERVGKPANG